jgi:Beta-propeller repeat
VIVGGTPPPGFPTTPGVFPRNVGNPAAGASDPSDVFVMKVSPTGHTLWAGTLGGPAYDRAYGVAVDPQGNIYVAGRAGDGFPVTSGAFQTTFMGGFTAQYGDQDGFVCKIPPDGTRILWCSYFGTSDPRIIRDVAVDASGNVYIASGWESGAYPAGVASKFLNGPRGGADAVAAKISTDGSHVIWARYIGGSGDENFQNSIQVDAAGNPYFLCTTLSSDAPTPNGADHTYGGNGDMYLAKLSPADGSTAWATYVGGSENESTETHELAVQPSGEVVVTGPTTSPDFPTTAGAFQRTYGGGPNDIFLSRYAPDGRLLAATFLGGTDNDRAEGIAIDAAGNIHLTGTTTSPNVPTTSGALHSTITGPRDAVIVVMPPDLSAPLSSTYWGGLADEYGRSMAVGSGGVSVVGGETGSATLPGAGTAPSTGPWIGFVIRLTGTRVTPAPPIAAARRSR